MTEMLATKTLREWVAHYRAKLVKGYGVRVTARSFAVIDALTDG